jgi:hypothetical protein
MLVPLNLTLEYNDHLHVQPIFFHLNTKSHKLALGCRSKPIINGYLVKFEFKVLARIWVLDVEINMG